MRLWGPFYANNPSVQLQNLALKNLNSLNLIIIALYSYMSNQPLEYVRPMRSLLNEVNTSPNYQLSIVLQLRVGIPAHPLAQCLDFVWIQLLQVLWTLPQLLWAHVCNCPVVFEKHYFFEVMCQLHLSFCFLCRDHWRLRGTEYGVDVSFSSELSIVTCSLHCGHFIFLFIPTVSSKTSKKVSMFDIRRVKCCR